MPRGSPTAEKRSPCPTGAVVSRFTSPRTAGPLNTEPANALAELYIRLNTEASGMRRSVSASDDGIVAVFQDAAFDVTEPPRCFAMRMITASSFLSALSALSGCGPGG